jgi:von Hippel-Lindau disease tumor supressor
MMLCVMLCSFGLAVAAEQQSNCIPGLDPGCRPSEMTADLCKDESKYRSTNGDLSVSLQFRNATDSFVTVYWLDYQGQRRFYNRLQPGSGGTYQTFVTHPWIITDGDDRCLLLYLPTTNASQVIRITKPQ